MSAINYYSTKSRVAARTERIRTDMDRSSAYIMDSSSNRPSYTSTRGRESSYMDDNNRLGRSRIRDTSLDISSRPRRTGSVDYSAPVKMRTRDRSMDYSSHITPTYTANSRAPRPKTVNYEDDDEHSAEYKKIMEKTDVTLAMSKYSNKADDAAKVEGMIEEERRSKAYGKIINQTSTNQLEKDAIRQTMSDIFADCKTFSAKTMNAINKEVLYNEDKGSKKKNYGWRKDMESYEDTLDKMSEHRRNVRDSTRATRDVKEPTQPYRDLNSRLKNYDRECKRDVDRDHSPVKRISVSMTPSASRKSDYSSYKAPDPPSSTYTNGISNGTSSYTNGTSSYSNGISSQSNDNDYDELPTNKPKRGSWRKDIEAFEENISKKPPVRHTETKAEPTKVNTWQKSSIQDTKVNVSTTSTSVNSSYSTKYATKAEDVKPVSVTISIEDPKPAEIPKWKKPEPVVIEDKKPVEIPKWKQSEAAKIEESKPVVKEETKPTKVETKLNENKTSSVLNKTEQSKLEETKTDSTTPKWKKPAPTKNEEVKPTETPKPAPIIEKKDESKPAETSKPVPKWKKQVPATKEEPKPAETPKPTPKWKKPETKPVEQVKPVEVKTTETEKPVPKWKKQTAVKTEEPKPESKPAEAPKPTPKWKKPDTVKKEEPKPVEPEKPVPKWKKQAAVKKEEPKPAEPEKPVPKWKKPEAAKKEDTKPVEPEKTVPKWKKPEVAKKEEPETPVPVPEPQVEEAKSVPLEESRLKPDEKAEEKPTESAVENKENVEEEKKEEEEQEDTDGMRAMAKEQKSKFNAMEEEFTAGASKLSALRAKMKALRMKHKAAAEADAEAEAARQG